MIIGIEAQRLFRRKKHGMDIVALEIIKQLQAIDHEDQFILFAKDDEDKNCFSPAPNFRAEILPSKPYPVWEQSSLPKYARKANISLLHCTANTAPLFWKKPLVVTIHDVIYMGSPEFSGSAYQNFGNLYRRFIVPRVAKKAVRIITVSAYAKKLIAGRLNIPATKIDVVYNGVNPQFRQLDNMAKLDAFRKKQQLPEKYLLHFGNTAPRKNTKGILKAYLAYTSAVAEPLPLVISGCPAELINNIVKEINAPALMQHIVIPGYLATEDLPCLYNLAAIFLFASLDEGFGMPLVEAMACGTPVITSNISCLPEIAGDAALLVDPYQPAEIARAISSLLEDKALYRSKQELGLINATRFSWKNAAEKTLSIYKAIPLK